MIASPSAPAEERLADDPSSELWGEHLSRYRFACRGVAALRVLDVACGAGFGLRLLQGAGARAIGMDLDFSALAEGRSLSGGPTACADVTRLPLPRASLDRVVSFETLEHVPDAEAMVAELAGVLRPTGDLILSTPNLAFGPPELHTRNPFHVREFSAGELAALLGLYFDDVVIHGQWPGAGYRYVPFRMVDRDVTPRALAWKLQNRLPFSVKDALSRVLTGRSFYPGETDYEFVAGAWEGAHDLVAVARRPQR